MTPRENDLLSKSDKSVQWKKRILGDGDKILNLLLSQWRRVWFAFLHKKFSLALGSYRMQVEKEDKINLSSRVLDLNGRCCKISN